MDPISLFVVIQFFLSAFLVFGAINLAIRAGISIFRVKNARVRSFLRGIPIVSVCLDVVLNQVRIGNWFNPFNCVSCLQKLLIFSLPKGTQEHIHQHHMSFAEWAAPQIPMLFMQGVIVLLAGITIGMVTRAIFQFVYGNRMLKQILKSTTPYLGKVQDATLRAKLSQVRLLVSKEIEIPFAAKDRFIIIPDSLLSELSQSQMDAVIAHEWEHLRWKDPYVRFSYHMISSFFWWIPMKNWLQQIEDDQEEACDQGVLRQKIDSHYLATAILKTTRRAKQSSSQGTILCSFAAKTPSSLRRVQTIFEGPRIDASLASCLIGTAVGVLIAVSCMM